MLEEQAANSNRGLPEYDSKELISQWVTSIVNVESKSRDNLKYLNTILGPLKDNVAQYDETSSNATHTNDYAVNEASNGSDGGFFTHEIIFKINEKVFIEGLNIYEKVVADSSILKIEALEIDDNKSEFSLIRVPFT